MDDFKKKPRPEIKETGSATFNIAGCTYTFSLRSIPIMNYKYNSNHNSQIKHGQVLYTLDTIDHLTSCISRCLNIDGFASTEEIFIWMMLAGYIVPLVSENDAALSKMLATLSLSTEQHTQLLKKYFKIVPILQVPKSSYPLLTAEYFKSRFPQRTKRIQSELLTTLYPPMDEWIKRALSIFTDFTSGHSVSPAIFANDSDAEQWLVPPYHTLSPEALKVVCDQLPTPYTSITVSSKEKPMQCQVCMSNTAWSFAYKHCGCRASFRSCFNCALREWYSLYFLSPNMLLNGSHVFVTCSDCTMEWSLISLLHVQGAQSWFRAKAQEESV